jgi:hypothetical protein
VTVWERHAERIRAQAKIERRREEFRRIDQWLLTHPRAHWPIALFSTLVVLVLAELLRLGLDTLARWVYR